MPKSKYLNFESFDPEIERTIKAFKKKKNITPTSTMANQHMTEKALRHYIMPSIDGTISSIRRPTIQASHFEIKHAIIPMI